MFTMLFKSLFKQPLSTLHFEKYIGVYEQFLLKRNNTYVQQGDLENMLPYSRTVRALSRYDLENLAHAKATRGTGSGDSVMLSLNEIERMDFEEPEKLSELSNESINAVADRGVFNSEFRYEMLLKVDLTKLIKI